MSATDVMKAWQFDAFGGKLEETLFLNNNAEKPRSALLPDEILVHVISTSVNPVDYKIAEIKAARLAISLPASPALDFCGRVVSTGTAIDSLRNGELVFGRLGGPSQFGALGEYIITNLTGCALLPSGVSTDDAACVGTAGLTALQCIQPNVEQGSKVFINGGSGGTGMFGIQIAKALGCIVTTSCSTSKIDLCKKLGADSVIDYQSSDIIEKLKQDGMTYDLVVDNVGIPSNLYVEANHILKETGKYVQVGSGMSMSSLAGVASRMLRPSFMGGGSRKYQFLGVKNESSDELVQLGKWIKDGKIKVVIDTAFEYTEAPKAYERLKSGQVKGKVVVHVTQE